MEYQRATKAAQKEQSKTPSSSLGQISLNHIAVHPLLQLQRTIGNQAVLNLLHSENARTNTTAQTFVEPRYGHDFSRIPIHSTQIAVPQANLKVNQPGDVYEQEADQVAEQVMRMADSESSVSGDEGEAKNSLMRKQTSGPGAYAAGETSSVPPIVHDMLNIGEGQPLDTTTRAFMEPRFGYDFSQVRVHTDEQAAESARSVNAQAYTAGRHIVFGQGHYSLNGADRRLLAHELTHIIHQGEQTQIPSGNHTAQGMRALSIQRKPDDKTTAPKPAASASAKATPQKGLSRTLYVVSNDVWEQLPVAVRTSAVKQLNTLFAFVGMASGEKPFSIKIVTAAQLADQFDFSESVVSVIRDDPDAYVSEAFTRQRARINSWLTEHKVAVPKTPAESKETFSPGKIGSGGEGRSVITDHGQSFALPIMAGAVNIDQVIDSFFDNTPGLLTDQLENLPKKGRDPKVWPPTVKSKGGTTSWQPLEMLGEALGRAIAHEARHEYMGAPHAETGLGQDSPFIIGEKNTANFSKEDQKAILNQLHKLEAQQGKATVVPTYPQKIRSQPDSFPY